jgi:hypothetical protein
MSSKIHKRNGGGTSLVTTTAIVFAILGPLVLIASLLFYTQSSNAKKPVGNDSPGFFENRWRIFSSDCKNQNLPPAPLAPSLTPVPKGLGLANSFATEGFRLDHIHTAPGNDSWRLCTVEGSDQPSPCPTADFFVVNQRDGFSDGVVDWLVSAEEHVIDLVSTIMSTKFKKSCLRKTLPCLATASQFTEEERSKLLMLDIGSNHGFYALMSAAAAPWLTVYSFEPQPHCAAYIQVAAEASGFSERLMVLNSLAGTPELAAPGREKKSTQVGRFVVPPPSEKTLSVPRRTGCRGTFPTLLAEEWEAVKKGYAHIPGALDNTDIGYVDPSRLVGKDQKVLFAKIDVEGFEEEVLDALHELLSQKRIYNILIELNKPQKLRRMGRQPDATDPIVVEWCAKIMKRLQDYGYTLVPQWGGYKTQPTMGTSSTAINDLAKAGWTSVDIFAYLPREEAPRAKKSRRHREEIEEDDIEEEVPEEEEADDVEEEEEQEEPVRKIRKRKHNK